jgi:hypothetical protein
MAIRKEQVVGYLEDVRDLCVETIDQVNDVLEDLALGRQVEMKDYDRLSDCISDLKHDGDLMLDRLGMGGFVNED